VSTLKYQGYEATVEYDNDDNIFVGRIVGINDIVAFHGTSVEELKQAFEESVADYLAACKEFGKAPDKSYSGKLVWRTTPELHARAAKQAEINGKSLNNWLSETVASAC